MVVYFYTSIKQVLFMNKIQIAELMDSVKENEKNKHVHTPYCDSSGNLPDFEVEYELDVSPELKDIKLTQGVRTDFLYEGDDPLSDGIHMVWPEFLEDEKIILDKRKEIPKSGKALMWILSPEAREKTHRQRIKVGTTGFFVVGQNKVAKVKVTKILGIFKNQP